MNKRLIAELAASAWRATGNIVASCGAVETRGAQKVLASIIAA
jgi:hypothetical protein